MEYHVGIEMPAAMGQRLVSRILDLGFHVVKTDETESSKFFKATSEEDVLRFYISGEKFVVTYYSTANPQNELTKLLTDLSKTCSGTFLPANSRAESSSKEDLGVSSSNKDVPTKLSESLPMDQPQQVLKHLPEELQDQKATRTAYHAMGKLIEGLSTGKISNAEAFTQILRLIGSYTVWLNSNNQVGDQKLVGALSDSIQEGITFLRDPDIDDRKLSDLLGYVSTLLVQSVIRREEK